MKTSELPSSKDGDYPVNRWSRAMYLVSRIDYVPAMSSMELAFPRIDLGRIVLSI